MKIVLFDEVQESALSSSLGASLRQLGHSVVETGPIGRGHSPAEFWQDSLAIRKAYEEIIECKPDAIVNFRPGSLSLRSVLYLKSLGIFTAVWLSDDPVLYQKVYSKIADGYDLVLHAGNQEILKFYDFNGHKPGVVFPFWSDRKLLPYSYNIELQQEDYIFLGNATGRVKSKRYGLLSMLRPDIRAVGNVTADEHSFFEPPIYDFDKLVQRLQRVKIGVNIPQFFSDYKYTGLHFSALDALGWFEIPSRLVQYAALGMPIVSLGCNAASNHFPLAVSANDGDDVRRKCREILLDDGKRKQLSIEIRANFEQKFSSDSRAVFLQQLIAGTIVPARMSLLEREFTYGGFDTYVDEPDQEAFKTRPRA